MVEPLSSLSALRASLDELSRARAALELAQQRVDAMRDQVHLRMEWLGDDLARHCERPPADVVREIYWQHPEVHVEAISSGLRFGSSHQLRRQVGVGIWDEECRGGCGVILAREVRTRTEARQSTSNVVNDPRYCASCRAEAQARQRIQDERWRRAMAEESAANRELLARAIADGAEPTARYHAYPNVPGTWLVEKDPEATD